MVSSQPVIFDRKCHRAHRARAAALGPSTFLIDRVAEDLCDRLAAVLRRFECALDLGTPTDAVRRVLAASGKVGTIIAADALAGTAAFRRLSDSRRKPEPQLCIAADEEALPLWDASLAITGQAVQVLVTGQASTSINWLCYFEANSFTP